jgi:hypothetical protein
MAQLDHGRGDGFRINAYCNLGNIRYESIPSLHNKRPRPIGVRMPAVRSPNGLKFQKAELF